MALSMERWRGKVAVVVALSGANGAITKRLVEHGMKVIILARRINKLINKLTEEMEGNQGELHCHEINLEKSQEITDAFRIIEEKNGPVHILVINAVITRSPTLSDADLEDWKEILGRIVLIHCFATRIAVGNMKRNNIDGHIIYISNMSGDFSVQSSTDNVYSVSKYVLTSLTNELRVELAEAGTKIKVTSISPEGSNKLAAGDIADVVEYVLSTPSHVQVPEMMVRPMGSVE